jgi:hypothetical protein
MLLGALLTGREPEALAEDLPFVGVLPAPAEDSFPQEADQAPVAALAGVDFLFVLKIEKPIVDRKEIVADRADRRAHDPLARRFLFMSR